MKVPRRRFDRVPPVPGPRRASWRLGYVKTGHDRPHQNRTLQVEVVRSAQTCYIVLLQNESAPHGVVPQAPHAHEGRQAPQTPLRALPHYVPGATHW